MDRVAGKDGQLHLIWKGQSFHNNAAEDGSKMALPLDYPCQHRNHAMAFSQMNSEYVKATIGMGMTSNLITWFWLMKLTVIAWQTIAAAL
ncbi:hypothetical protein chiPu_0014616 [Chiloscyllium punctatum]|uniref:Uncharacterized protein n=1 Tax=Chiloscyllium punctatum TaxID=137246 RepID=A0A401T0G4_CHIPU|nr:hypothetical protein [Chiloscyllium punctatum]